MSLSIGIVGLPNVGKSTLFNALTKGNVPSENFPFCTIDPSIGIVPVPDERLDHLTKLSASKKTIPTFIEFVDIAGIIEGAHKGEGLGNTFLAHIREVDAIAQVVRIFDDKKITHVSNTIDPLSDVETIGLELVMADLQTVSKKIARLEKDAKRGDKLAQEERSLLEKVQQVLEAGSFASTLSLSKDEEHILKSSHLLTKKPIVYVLNKKHGGQNLDELEDERWKKLVDFFKNNDFPWVIVDAHIEQDLSRISEKDQKELREGLSFSDDGLGDLVSTCYEKLSLITFFTSGEEETRAWTIQKGAKAPIAGSRIHSDFCDKFIRAAVISCEDLVESASWKHAKEKGQIRLEGKDYVVQDGDVIEFKI